MGSRGEREKPKPTEAELAILRVLWERGPSTVREVNESLRNERRTGYTTILKLLQIMTEKGLVKRDERFRTHVYRAALPQSVTLRLLVRDLIHRAFGGSAPQLVLHALADRRAEPGELAEIRKMLDQLEGERQ